MQLTTILYNKFTSIKVERCFTKFERSTAVQSSRICVKIIASLITWKYNEWIIFVMGAIKLSLV